MAGKPVNDSVQRFEAKVLMCPMSGCWLWTACTQSDGYGWFKHAGTAVLAHRWSYEHHVGPIPEGLQIDHLCRVRRCVNPAHLEPVTSRENVLRGIGICSTNAGKTHCPQGHPFSGQNLRTNPAGGRRCRICINSASSRYRRKRVS